MGGAGAQAKQGALWIGVSQHEGGVAGFYSIMPTGQEKNQLVKSTNVFLFFTSSQLLIPPETIVSSPVRPARSPLVAPALLYLLHHDCLFLVGCCMWNIVARPSKATTYLICAFFASLNSPPRTKRQHDPICSAPAAFPLHHPFYRFCQLFVDCCFFWPNNCHLRPTSPLSLCFLMCLVLLAQTREPAIAIANPALDACNRPIGSDGAMIWGHHCCVNGERAKPLERAAAAAHFDCCVLCVCVWLCFVCESNL